MTRARDLANNATGAAPTLIDAKGDLLVGSAADTAVRLAVGSNDTVLTADSSATSGLKWAAAGSLPTGTVINVASSTAPAGYLKANGAAVSRSTYAALFTAIGTTFGSGDGSTTFTLPDLRGRFTRNWADDGSIDSGRSFGSSQEATSLTVGGGVGREVQYQNSDGTDGSASGYGSSLASNSTVSYQKVRPTNVALLACIKF